MVCTSLGSVPPLEGVHQQLPQMTDQRSMFALAHVLDLLGQVVTVHAPISMNPYQEDHTLHVSAIQELSQYATA
jgi:hypothetical protein